MNFKYILNYIFVCLIVFSCQKQSKQKDTFSKDSISKENIKDSTLKNKEKFFQNKLADLQIFYKYLNSNLLDPYENKSNNMLEDNNLQISKKQIFKLGILDTNFYYSHKGFSLNIVNGKYLMGISGSIGFQTDIQDFYLFDEQGKLTKKLFSINYWRDIGWFSHSYAHFAQGTINIYEVKNKSVRDSLQNEIFEYTHSRIILNDNPLINKIINYKISTKSDNIQSASYQSFQKNRREKVALFYEIRKKLVLDDLEKRRIRDF